MVNSISTVCVGALVVLATTAGVVDANDDDNNNTSNDVCGLYLAISSTSTPDETNWGIFAGSDLKSGSSIGSPDIGINMPFMRANSIVAPPVSPQNEEDQANQIQLVDHFEGFFWVPETAAATYEMTEGRSITAVPGAGVLAAYKHKMNNIDWVHASGYRRQVMGDETGVNHPMRGANSPFYGMEVQATKDVMGGSELFISFGDNWADDNDEENLETDDYAKVDETVGQMIQFFARHKDALDEDAKQEIYSFLTKDVLKAAIGVSKARRVQAMLPPTPDELYKVPQKGGIRAFSAPSSYRSPDWLAQYGLCMDNVRLGASTITNAGRGAFATRALAVDQMITPVPVAHIPHKDILNMYTVQKNSEGHFARANNKVNGQQIMLNYCYGHPESTMLLFPSGAVAAAINHSDKPNAKLVWSKHSGHHKSWLSVPPEELLQDDYCYVGMVLEVVATQAITPGDEIFLDYGPEWRAAYANYVAEWESTHSSADASSWPIRAVDLNTKYATAPFPTPEELTETPLPTNVALKAFLLLQDEEKAGTMEDPKNWGEDDDETAYLHEHLFDVQVIDRVASPTSSYLYTVLWTSGKTGKQTYVGNVPHDALIFVDKPGTSDQFTNNAFRHYIGLPDDIFPQGPWRNVA